MIRKFDTPRAVTVAFPGGVIYQFDFVISFEERKDKSIVLTRVNGTENIINNSYDYIEIGEMI